jgi:hypothetical protein
MELDQHSYVSENVKFLKCPVDRKGEEFAEAATSKPPAFLTKRSLRREGC